MFRKASIFFFTTLFLGVGISAQESNSVAVSDIVSPIAHFNYKLEDSVDFIIRIRNIGPNEIIGADQFLLSYSISNNDTSFSVDTTLRVGSNMPVNTVLEYTIRENIGFNSSNQFSVCADVRRGTVLFPDNQNKFPGQCNSFVVGIEKNELPLTSIFYSMGKLHFSLGQNSTVHASIYNISAKRLIRKTISGNQSQRINFSAPSKGIYFLVVEDNNGNRASAKFVVN